MTECRHYQKRTATASMGTRSVVSFYEERRNWFNSHSEGEELTDEHRPTASQACRVIVMIASVLARRDPSVWAGGHHRAHLAARQLLGHNRFHLPVAVLSGESRPHPATGLQIDHQEDTARHWWWDYWKKALVCVFQATEIKFGYLRYDKYCMIIYYYATFGHHIKLSNFLF